MSIDINKIPAGNESRDDSAISARTDNVSFAETALRLGGKTAEEARRTGVVDTADVIAGGSGCRGCSSTAPTPGGALALLGVLGLLARRRRPARQD